jgi:hypothetical protein
VVASLTKESLVLFAGGLALWMLLRKSYRTAILAGAVPAAAVVAWSFGARNLTGGQGRLGGGNWSLPLRGIIDASSFWPSTPAREQAMTAIAIGLVVLGYVAFAVSKSSLARCLLLPWLALPIVTSEWVWRFGNGSLRGFAPIGVLAAFAFARRPDTQPRIDTASQPLRAREGVG